MRDVDAEIAAAYGCTLHSIGAVHEDGADWPEHYAECADNAAAIGLLNLLADNDAETSARVKAIAAACRAWGAHTDESTARQAQAFVQSAIAFKNDPLQIFRPSDLTLLRRVGNCVNSARLTDAIVRAAGLRGRCVPVEIGGEIRHTAAQAWVDGAWRWLEGTITARYDEAPLAALARGAVACERGA